MESISDRNSMACMEYAKDIFAWMKSREPALRNHMKQSPQLSQRLSLVNWTSKVAEKLELCNSTLHLAVRIIDFFMDGHDIQDPQLYLVCLGSLLLSAKMEERDYNVPKCSELNQMVQNRFPVTDFVAVEFVILKYFKWNLSVPTACLFTELLVSEAIHPTDLQDGHDITNFGEIRCNFLELVKLFLNLSLQELEFVSVRPSLLGSAVILMSRSISKLRPLWPENLEHMSGYGVMELAETANRLLICKNIDEERSRGMDSPDKGYYSVTASPESCGRMEVFEIDEEGAVKDFEEDGW